VLWLTPPPYLRRLVAGLALVVALAIDLTGNPTVDHPFVIVDIAAGAPIEPTDVEYRPVPAEMLPVVPDPVGFAARDLLAGDPLTPSALTNLPPPPEDWWSIRTPLPVGTVVGTRVRLISAEPNVDVVGVVTGVPAESMLGGELDGMVAVPPDAAAAVADAAARRTLTVLIGT
jgi:hypothetical protein